jgi:polysaccharide deacetylase family protein (PEP-CTERM system associated)
VVNALTVDVEDYFHVQAFANVIGRHQWDRFPTRVERNTYRLLELLGRKGVRATFFVLGWVAMRCPSLVAQIARAGHEIGCHGFAHQAIYSGDEQDFRNDLRQAKQVIEDTLGAAVRSYRAPSYSITAKTLWALEILGEEGFENDSSIFPVIHDHYGMPGAPRFPHVKTLGSGRKLKEFPPTTIRMLGLNFPVAGGGYLRLFPYRLTQRAIHWINQIEAQPAMVYVHPWELDPEQPRIAAPRLSRFRQYQNLASTETKFARLLDDFRWGTMEDVLASSLGQARG